MNWPRRIVWHVLYVLIDDHAEAMAQFKSNNQIQLTVIVEKEQQLDQANSIICLINSNRGQCGGISATQK